jgi:predicted NACHT family NTPase
MIEQLRERNFILCYMGADCYAFVHRTFLEYFCACEFNKQFAKRGSVNGLTIEELKTDVFGKHWQDETWHEVLLLIAGMIEAEFVGEIIDELMAQDGEKEKFVNLFLAAKCLVEVRSRSVIASTANKLLNEVQDLTKYDLWYYYDPQPYTEETKLVQEIRTQAVTAIATTWQESSETKSWLKERATKDDDNFVRGAAVQELAKNFKDDPETKSILKERATKDDDNYVRGAAVQELAKNFKDDADLFDIYYQCAVNDPFKGSHESYRSNPRRIALEIIIKQYPQHPQTLPLLRDRAENDPDEQVREYAQKKLAQLSNN